MLVWVEHNVRILSLSFSFPFLFLLLFFLWGSVRQVQSSRVSVAGLSWISILFVEGLIQVLGVWFYVRVVAIMFLWLSFDVSVDDGPGEEHVAGYWFARSRLVCVG